MREVACRHCAAAVQAPDELAGVRCPRCGQPLAPAETRVTAHPIAAQTIKADAQPEYRPSALPPPPEPPRGRYASWDDFRSNSPVVQRKLLELATRALPDMRNMPWARLPVDLPPAADDLGVPIASVLLADDAPAAMLALRVTAAVAVPLGAVLSAALVQRHLGINAVFVLALAACGGLILLIVLKHGVLRRWSFQPGRLWLFEHGILWQSGAELSSRRFEDIEDFRALRDGTFPRYLLVPRRGSRLSLSLCSVIPILPLAEYIEIGMASAQLLPKLERIVAGERVRFGAVVLDASGLVGPGIRAPWSQVVRVMGDGKSVFVECRDQPDWHSLRVSDVSCPTLVLAIAHILIEEAQRLPVNASAPSRR